MKKPELLLPAGNADMAMCAFEGGADAVYAGIQKFNARQRAKNFSKNEMYSMIDYAHQNNKKVYITLNTLLKNSETFDFADLLEEIVEMNPDAIIIQDWGVYYLVKKYLKDINIHASTQMGIHNSIGSEDSKKRGFERVVLARELTFHELETIAQQKKTQLELFVHGSLCYSMSGHCLFSSYLGGMSANRGLCKQPCRRQFSVSKEQHYLFSLKDLQLIDYIPQIMNLGIESLKIEGRMKSADYVYNTARAYRLAIDDHSRIEEAKSILNYDLARDKTSYFLGEDVHDVFSSPTVGGYLGKIEEVRSMGNQELRISLKSEMSFHDYAKIRIVASDDDDTDLIEIKSLLNEDLNSIEKAEIGAFVHITFNVKQEQKINKDNDVYLVSDFKLNQCKALTIKKFNYQSNHRVKNMLKKDHERYKNQSVNDEHYIRLDNPLWLDIVQKEDFSKLIVAFTRRMWQEKSDFIDKLKAFKNDIIIDLPLYIAEENIDFYRTMINERYDEGFRHFSISQINQLGLLEGLKNVRVMANENIYTLNDMSINFVYENGIDRFIYPFENDFDNLFTGKDRSGIIPLFFYPKLFFSRMPVNIKSNAFFSDIKYVYSKYIKDGLTNVVSKKPVSIYHFYDKVYKKGFKRFMTDLSFCEPSHKLYNEILQGYYNHDKLPNSSSFNFKKGLW